MNTCLVPGSDAMIMIMETRGKEEKLTSAYYIWHLAVDWLAVHIRFMGARFHEAQLYRVCRLWLLIHRAGLLAGSLDMGIEPLKQLNSK
jgi:hypothetical protein